VYVTFYEIKVISIRAMLAHGGGMDSFCAAPFFTAKKILKILNIWLSKRLALGIVKPLFFYKSIKSQIVKK